MEGRQYHNDWLYLLQLKLQLDPPLAHAAHSEDSAAADDLIGRVLADEEFALDVVDFALQSTQDGDPYWGDAVAGELNGILSGGNSAWEAVQVGERLSKSWRLERRSAAPVREAIEDMGPTSDRARHHLLAARENLAGRDVDASGAYREAIRAVEAIAKPVILPNDSLATLGKMIGVLKDRPAKWETTLGSVEDVRRDMETVWKGQRDRHGTDDESVPLSVSAGEADAAFCICLALVQLFANGHVRLAEPSQ
jgi:hypothetical protein